VALLAVIVRGIDCEVTVSVAVAVLLIPPYKELTELLAVNVPAVVPVTCAVTVQDAPAGRVNAVIVNEVPSALAVATPTPGQVTGVVNGLGNVRPAGRATITPGSTLRGIDELGLV
jgi:hypothetical protein